MNINNVINSCIGVSFKWMTAMPVSYCSATGVQLDEVLSYRI